MAKEYKKENIKKTYFTIVILDSCGDVYDEISGVHCPQTMLGCARKIDELKQQDKELGKDFGVWSYRIAKHEEDDDSDWQTIYKVYKRHGHYYAKVDESF